MKLDNICRARMLIKKLSIAEAALEEVSSIPQDWVTMKVVVMGGGKAREYNINHDMIHADGILIKTMSVLQAEISNIELELKTL